MRPPRSAQEDRGPTRPPTQYETRLYSLCSVIPPGKVSTYGALAEVLRSSPRAVGQALRRNPFAPKVPCHRVIAASLELGGFSGSWGLHCANVQRKRALLSEEGVEFDGRGKLLQPRRAMAAEELRREWTPAARPE